MSARLPPMWPRFVSRTRRHMWVEFVVACSEGFFSGFPPCTSKFGTTECRATFEDGYNWWLVWLDSGCKRASSFCIWIEEALYSVVRDVV